MEGDTLLDARLGVRDLRAPVGSSLAHLGPEDPELTDLPVRHPRTMRVEGDAHRSPRLAPPGRKDVPHHLVRLVETGMEVGARGVGGHYLASHSGSVATPRGRMTARVVERIPFVLLEVTLEDAVGDRSDPPTLARALGHGDGTGGRHSHLVAVHENGTHGYLHESIQDVFKYTE